MKRREVVRYYFSLPKALSERFEKVAPAPGESKSSLLAAAVEFWLDQRDAGEFENKFIRRLERIALQLGRVERNGHILIESLALFVRYMLTVNAPIAHDDETSRAIGRDRFNAFVQRVGQQLASGRMTLAPDEET
jgi:hypothetical protein